MKIGPQDKEQITTVDMGKTLQQLQTEVARRTKKLNTIDWSNFKSTDKLVVQSIAIEKLNEQIRNIQERTNKRNRQV